MHKDGSLGVRGRNSGDGVIRERLGWVPSERLRIGLEGTYTKGCYSRQHT
jgi:GDP-D-mannose 3', 5'-epimerase